MTSENTSIELISKTLPKILLQDVIIGGSTVPEDLRAAGFDVEVFSAPSSLSRKACQDILGDVAPGSIHCSVNMADALRRFGLGRQVLSYNPEKLRFTEWSSLVPAQFRLNRNFVVLPFGELATRETQLRTLFGEALFLRPMSSRKPFPGQPLFEDLATWCSMVRQLHNIHDNELVIIDQYQEIQGHEWRVWMAFGEPVAKAPYLFDPEGSTPRPETCPQAIDNLIAILPRRAPMLEVIDDYLVMDFCLDGQGVARLVEINAWSTSGFYPGVNGVDLMKAFFFEPGIHV